MFEPSQTLPNLCHKKTQNNAVPLVTELRHLDSLSWQAEKGPY